MVSRFKTFNSQPPDDTRKEVGKQIMRARVTLIERQMLEGAKLWTNDASGAVKAIKETVKMDM